MPDSRDPDAVPAPGSPPATGRPARAQPSLPQLVLELRDLLVTYLRQETVVPIQRLGRYLAYGVAGSLLMGTGVLLLAVGGLRLLQTETGDTFRGDWSWVPYLVVFVVLVVGAAVVWTARRTARVQREPQR